MTVGHMKPEFLTVEDVLGIHAEVIAEFGGDGALRDLALLESAVAMPQQTFGGEFLHDFAVRHGGRVPVPHHAEPAFVDGNKRTAHTATLVFLRLNLIVIDRDVEQLEELTMGVAQGRLDKAAIAAELEAIWMAETRGGAAVDLDNSSGGEEPQAG